MQTVNLGFGSVINAERIIAVVSYESAPIKRQVQNAREAGTLIDVTYGRKTRAVVIMDSAQLIVSAVAPETIAGRLGGKDE